MTSGSAVPRNLGPVELAELFGGAPDDVTRWCDSLLATVDLRYHRLERADRDRAILEALDQLHPDTVLPISAPERLADWEAGWSENLSDFLAADYSLEALVPKYLRPNNVVRLLRDFARPINPLFVRDYTNIYRAWLAHRFFAEAEAIYEFGCGPGSHLAYLAQTFPGKQIVGLDWARSSQDILTAMSRRYGWNVIGRQFDFFSPDLSFSLPPGTAVLTFGALEQVGQRHGPFLDYLLANRPLRCVHVEPINELYETDNLLDYLALRYHQKRRYLWNLLTRLLNLEREGRLVIEAVHRQHFGNRFDDTYSTVVWRPL